MTDWKKGNFVAAKQPSNTFFSSESYILNVHKFQ